MKPEQYSERKLEIKGWPVNVTSYKLGDQFYCKVDNVSPGAWLARTHAPTREDAEKQAVDRATKLLGRTQRQAI